MSIVNLKDYRTAKKLVADLDAILKAMNSAKKDLRPFIRYHHVRMVLENLVRNSDVLTVHLHKQLKIVAEAEAPAPPPTQDNKENDG